MRVILGPILILAALFPGLLSADIGAANKLAKSGAFDAVGDVRCAQEVGQSLGSCKAAASRADGSAAVVVTFANGFSRTLMFTGREFVRGNATMSGVGTDTEWQLLGGIYYVRVDDQRFELPQTLVFGE